jgi:hypothetical protein
LGGLASQSMEFYICLGNTSTLYVVGGHIGVKVCTALLEVCPLRTQKRKPAEMNDADLEEHAQKIVGARGLLLSAATRVETSSLVAPWSVQYKGMLDAELAWLDEHAKALLKDRTTNSIKSLAACEGLVPKFDFDKAITENTDIDVEGLLAMCKSKDAKTMRKAWLKSSSLHTVVTRFNEQLRGGDVSESIEKQYEEYVEEHRERMMPVLVIVATCLVGQTLFKGSEPDADDLAASQEFVHTHGVTLPAKLGLAFAAALAKVASNA